MAFSYEIEKAIYEFTLDSNKVRYAGDMSHEDKHHSRKLPLLRGFMDATSGDNSKWIIHMRNRAREATDQLNKTTCYVTYMTENGFKWMTEDGYKQVVHWIYQSNHQHGVTKRRTARLQGIHVDGQIQLVTTRCQKQRDHKRGCANAKRN